MAVAEESIREKKAAGMVGEKVRTRVKKDRKA